MTAPLTPGTCDLRGLPFMPLDVDRLLDSDTLALASPDEFRAAIILWCKAWRQVPAGSIPSDELALARMTQVSLPDWRRIAEGALRGWVLCDDGRLYHPVVAEKALRAWIERVKFKDRSAKANASRHERFSHQPEQYEAIRREAVVCLERLCPGTALEFGVVLQAGEGAPTRSESAPSRSPARTAFSSEEREKGEGERRDSERDISLVAGATEARQAFDLYNLCAAETGIPKAKAFTPERQAKIAKALNAHGLDGWQEALDAIRASRFCQGHNNRQWAASLDFMLQPASLNKLRDGVYERLGNDPGGSAPRGYLDVAMGEVH